MMYPTPVESVDRTKQLERIQAILSEPLKAGESSLGFKAFEFFGIEGIGKSRVLSQAKKECASRKYPFFSMTCSPAWLERGMDDWQIKFSLLRSIQEQLDQNWPGSGMAAQAQSALLEWERNLRASDAESELKRVVGILLETLGDAPFILMMDQVEYCPQNVFDWLGREFLRLFVEAGNSNGTLAFFGGRGPRVDESGWPQLLKKATESIRLDPFDFDNTEKHIVQIPLDGKYQSAAQFIYNLSNGHPYTTEMLVYELNEMGVGVGAVEEKRVELARKLYEETLRRYVLDSSPEWMKRFVEIACIPRWAKAEMLQELFAAHDDLPPEFPRKPELNWVIFKLSDLQEPPWHFMEVVDNGYRVEPNLRRLLHNSLAALRPAQTLALHRRALDFHRTRGGRVQNIMETLYHAAMVAMLSKGDIGREVEKELDRNLGEYDPQSAQQDLSQLKDALQKDSELNALIGKPVVVQLIRKIVERLQSGRDFLRVQIEHSSPGEYRASWYVEEQAIWPTEIIHSSTAIEQEKWRKDLQGMGDVAFGAYLPPQAQRFLQQNPNRPLQWVTNRGDIPWELLYAGDDFLCLRHPFARKLQEVSSQQDHRFLAHDKMRALIIANPTGDLKGAEDEANDLAKLLKEDKWEVDALYRDEAESLQILKRIKNTHYCLIHFAGHGKFETGSAKKSYLVCSDGDILDEDIQRQLNSHAFVYLSVCEGGQVETKRVLYGARGEFMNGISSCVLRAGAIGCLGPMWPIEDNLAREFAMTFYAHALDGETIAEAVRRARLAMKDRSPDFWASWILSGDPNRRVMDCNNRK